MELSHHTLSLLVLVAVLGLPVLCVLLVNFLLDRKDIVAPWWFLVMVAALSGVTGLAVIFHKIAG